MSKDGKYGAGLFIIDDHNHVSTVVEHGQRKLFVETAVADETPYECLERGAFEELNLNIAEDQLQKLRPVLLIKNFWNDKLVGYSIRTFRKGNSELDFKVISSPNVVSTFLWVGTRMQINKSIDKALTFMHYADCNMVPYHFDICRLIIDAIAQKVIDLE